VPHGVDAGPKQEDASGREPPLGTPPGRQFRGPLESALRHPLVATLPIVALVGIAAVIGLTRDPTYTANSSVSVGRADVPAAALRGVLAANAALAAGYARTIDAEPVVRPAGDAVGLSPSEVRDRLSASPVDSTTLIRIEAEGVDEAGAVRLSNAGARSLINYVEDLNRRQDTGGVLRRFRAARARVERAKTILDRLERDPSPSRARLEQARLDFASASLQAETVGNEYRALRGGPEARTIVQFVAPAADARSDRRSTLERLLLIALAAGVLVGVALALVLENSHLVGRKGS